MAGLKGCTKERQLQQDQKKAKKLVAKAKWEAGIQFYHKLETNEEEAKIYNVVRQRARAKKAV